MQTFCQNFGPIPPIQALHNITVIENTQMFYQAPEFCDDQSEDLNYVLTKGDGTGLDQWMIWDKTERIMSGLVPVGQYKLLYMRLTGTDKNGLSTNTLFNITFISKPYLNRQIDNYEVRTEVRFACQIPTNTFTHPNSDQMKITVEQVPTWLTYNPKDMTFSGRPSAQNVGTFTILVTATDSKNESTTTSFKIDVQKNYVPVVQKQVDDLQLDLNQPFEMQLERNTFVDPNGDTLNITGTRIPIWMKFSRTEMKLTGTPTLYGVYNVSITATDAWNASATMSFQIVAGIQPNTPPIVMTKLKDQ